MQGKNSRYAILKKVWGYIHAFLYLFKNYVEKLY